MKRAVLNKKQPVHIVPVSGGKDSQLVLGLIIDRFGRDHLRVVHQATGYDHPLTYEHMRYMEDRYQVIIENTQNKKYKDVFEFIRGEGYFPNNLARSCTSKLKQKPFADWIIENDFNRPGAAIVYLGMRTDESAARASSYAGLTNDDSFTLAELSPNEYSKLKHVTVILPIVTMLTADVFKALAARGDKVNPLYKKGHTRVGCYPCLLSNKKEWEIAVHDSTGRKHIEKLVQIEREFAAKPTGKKLVKIHSKRDIERLLRTGSFNGIKNLFNDDFEGGCSMCTI